MIKKSLQRKTQEDNINSSASIKPGQGHKMKTKSKAKKCKLLICMLSAPNLFQKYRAKRIEVAIAIIQNNFG